MDTEAGSQPCEAGADAPSPDELKAELLDIPELPEEARPPEPPGLERILAAAVGYVRGRRGGDLLAVILVGSGARRALTRHSDLDLIALVKGQDEGEDMVRVADRLVEVRYRAHKAVEQELLNAPRLPSLLRKGRVLFEHELAGTKLLEKATSCFRQGPPPVGLNDKIRLKAHCFHWLGKAEDLIAQPATARYLLGIFLDDLLQAFFRLRGFWLTAPADTLRVLAAREPALADLVERFLTAGTLTDRLALGRQLANQVFEDIPNPPRVD